MKKELQQAIDKASENLSKIKDVDKFVSEVKGYDEEK